MFHAERASIDNALYAAECLAEGNFAAGAAYAISAAKYFGVARDCRKHLKETEKK